MNIFSLTPETFFPPPIKPLRSSRCAYLSALVSEELPCVVNNLLVRQVGVRLLLTDAQHLPQSDSERPHVAGCGELPLQTRRRARALIKTKSTSCTASV